MAATDYIPGVGSVIGGIGSLLGGLFGSGPSEEELKAMGLLDQNQTLARQQGDYSSPALDYLPSYYSSPEQAQASTVTEDPQMRNAQIAALNSLLTRTNEGITAEELRQQDLSRRAQGETTRGQEEAIMNNMAARGIGGSGQEFALRQQAAQSAGDIASQQGLARESTNAQQKLNALNGLMTGATGVRSNDYTVNKGNADITNQFALENSRRNNAINQANTELSNQAQAANKQDAQSRYADSYKADVARRQAMQEANTNKAQGLLGQNVVRSNENNNIWGSVGNIGAGAANLISNAGSSSSNANNGSGGNIEQPFGFASKFKMPNFGIGE